jgi:HlyD family secretion protein
MIGRAIFPAAVCLALCGCFDKPAETVQGYVEGDFVNLGLPAGGRIVEVATARGDAAAAGQAMFRLDARTEEAALAEADAKRLQAVANLRLADVELKRQRTLVGTSAATEAKLDAAIAAQAAAEQAVAAADAARDKARVVLAERVAYAPAAARVEDVLFRVGEVVAAGQPVVRLLPPGNVVVRAYPGAKAVAALEKGVRAEIACAACPAGAFATVSFVSGEAAYAPPVLYSRDGRDKLTFLVELRPDAATAALLRPGQPVDIRLPKAAK